MYEDRSPTPTLTVVEVATPVPYSNAWLFQQLTAICESIKQAVGEVAGLDDSDRVCDFDNNDSQQHSSSRESNLRPGGAFRLREGHRFHARNETPYWMEIAVTGEYRGRDDAMLVEDVRCISPDSL